MPDLPTGTVTFLFTDIEGSTKLWEQHPEAMREALARHDVLLRQAIEQHHGHVVKGTGDGLHAVFSRASDALSACLKAQLAFQQEEQQEAASIRVRMALHTGAAQERDGDYFGSCVNRAARLMSIGHGGQVLLSEVTQGLVKDNLPQGASLKELGWHRLKDLQEAEQVFQLLHPGLPAEFPALTSLNSLPNNLPRQLTSFIGREKELKDVKQLLTSSPLVTLAGTGGSGKTRLALQVAAEVLEDYPQGVWLVELAALSDPSLVEQTVATSLGLREAPGQPLMQTLLDYIQPRTLLLVLDNCEHLIQPCATLAETLLQACPHLSLLATSREALKVTGEQVYRVPSLLAPDPAHLPQEEKGLAVIVSEYEAPHLFVERASLQKPEFTLTSKNAPVVASVCYRLDGIPLAIELAAARVNALSVEEINARLEHRFRLLRGSSRTALPRQQTLQATLDWSYDLLTEQERLLLGRLSVFAGGWRLEAAEAVCSDEQIKDFEVLDLLTSLVDKSLVIAEEWEGKSRYRLLETIREYGGQRLQERQEQDRWRDRHLQFFLSLAEEAEPNLAESEQAEWLEKLQEEHENLRAGLKWCQQDKVRQEAGLRLAGALRQFWDIRGYLSEGREHLQLLLSQVATSRKTPARNKALNAAGILAWRQGDYAAAQALHEESLAIKRELGDKFGLTLSLNNLGNVTWRQGDYAAAYVFHKENLELSRELGDKRGVGASLNNLGMVVKAQGDCIMARALYEESLAIFRQLGDWQAISASLNNLGIVAWSQGDYIMARALYEESLAICRQLGDKQGQANSLNNLGNVACSQGDYVAAYVFHKESLAIRRELGDKWGIAGSLEGIAEVAANQRQSERAAELWGAAETLRQAIDAPLQMDEKEEYDRKVAEARTSHGEPAFSAAWEAGRAMTLEQAIEYALQEDQQ